MTMQPLGYGHWTHPLLGQRVVDHAHDGRVGVFRAFAPDAERGPGLAIRVAQDTPLVVWLAPEGGGREWTTPLTAIEVVR